MSKGTNIRYPNMSDDFLKIAEYRNHLTSFIPSRMNSFEPDMNGYGFIFMTRPDLNINHKMTVDAKKDLGFGTFLNTLGQSTMGKRIINSLNQESSEISSKFIPLITNMFTSFTPHDDTMQTTEIAETHAGHKVILPDKMSDSRSGELSIEYNEDSYLSVTKLHKVWLDYIDNVTRGFVYPKPKNIEQKAIRVIDYMSSIYYIKTLPDLRTVTYFAKYTGVYPTSVPYSSQSFQVGQNDVTKLSINYAYSFKEDLDSNIIADFNRVTGMEKEISSGFKFDTGKIKKTPNMSIYEDINKNPKAKKKLYGDSSKSPYFTNKQGRLTIEFK